MNKWIKNSKGLKELAGYICDNSKKEIPGSHIKVYFPEDHIADTGVEGPLHFASDKDLSEFLTKLGKKYGAWKSKKIEKDVRPSIGGRKVEMLGGYTVNIHDVDDPQVRDKEDRTP